MSRFWTGVVDLIGQLLPLPLIVLIMLAVAAIIGLLWYFFPRWVPRRHPRFLQPRPDRQGACPAGRVPRPREVPGGPAAGGEAARHPAREEVPEQANDRGDGQHDQ